jgi:hypothetical protein
VVDDSLKQSASELDQLAREAVKQSPATAAQYSAMAREFRGQVGENLKEKGQHGRKKAVVEGYLKATKK